MRNDRRRLMAGSATTAALTGTLSLAKRAFAAAAPAGPLRVGLVGCGGRGSGSAINALSADPNVRLVAMGDAFEDQLQSSLARLRAHDTVGAKVDVPAGRQFVGFDAYKGVIDACDVVLLGTPPGFRPLHLQAAVAAGKHVFAEKPVAVDARGVRAVLAACEEARRKRLSVASGLCLRYDQAYQAPVARIHAGAIGDIQMMQATDLRATARVRPRQPSMTEMEYQMRNWYYFTWLSGDFNVEQHVHLLDACAWLLHGRYPVRAFGLGGRQQRTGPAFGHIYDHHTVVYEYADGLRLTSMCRQMTGCHNESAIHVAGTRGSARLSGKNGWIQTGRKRWEAPEPPGADSYQNEHDHLFSAIRADRPINHGEYMAKSTLMAIMGRMATYTGQLVTWEQAMASPEDLSPPKYTWEAELPPVTVPVPGPRGVTG